MNLSRLHNQSRESRRDRRSGSEDMANIVKRVGILPGCILWLAISLYPLPPALYTFSLSVLLNLLLPSTSSVITNFASLGYLVGKSSSSSYSSLLLLFFFSSSSPY